MTRRCNVASALLVSFCALACGGGIAPQELHSARDAMKQAEASKAPQLAPVQFDEAKQALSEAERAFKDGEDDVLVGDLSYIAMRKAELAVSAGNTEFARRDAEQANRDRENAQKSLLNTTEENLRSEQVKAERDRMRAAEEQRRLADAQKLGQQEVERVKQQLEAEKKAREEAEKRAASALASLEQIAKVKEESRGVVITLSGSVLFATGKHELLPIAQTKLDEVAKALKDQGFKKVVVEGHTDSRGSASQNEALSLARAQEVRNYLVSRGLPGDKVDAQGYGPRRPVSDNETPEGRANNRRVEIVVTPL